MRKNSARKLLHATLDLLPLIVIPIFGLYYFNHAIDEPLSVATSGYEITPLFETNDVNSLEDLVPGHVYHLDELEIDSPFGFDFCTALCIYDYEYVDWISTYQEVDEVILNYNYDSNSENYILLTLCETNGVFRYDFLLTNGEAYSNISMSSESTDIIYVLFENLDFSIYSEGGETVFDHFISICEALDYLPTRSDFQSYNVEYSEGIVYDDTDVGSQFIYSLYHVTDKYFNMGNVFNMKGVYEWFNTTLFGGNAPLAIKLVWEIVLYEFVMDLLMLLYSLFMFFIDFCTSLIERCYVTSKGGK